MMTIKNLNPFHSIFQRIWFFAWMLNESGRMRSKMKKRGNSSSMNKEPLVMQSGNTYLQIKSVIRI